jgi:hypothetical protein
MNPRLRSFQDRLRRVSFFLLLAGTQAIAQNGPTEHVFQVPRAELDRALQNLQATLPGRLPILEGFVASNVSALERYQRAYYQYKLEVRPAASGAMLLLVTAKVTAWYSGDSATPAGYRVLPSNGRLETDLLERLEEALQQNLSSVASRASSKETRAQSSTDRTSTTAVRPPASAKSSALRTPFPMEQPATRVGPAPPNARELAQQKRVRQLNEQAANLEEILRSQSRPNDLAAVLKTGTPVLAKPMEFSQVLFQADAEDEFKVLDESAGWVHVQVSGISRGWIRRSDLEMPGNATVSAAPESNQPAASPKPETHEDTSLFPGDWSALRGRTVRIVWVRPEPRAGDRWLLARSLFRDTYGRISQGDAKIEGVVIVVDDAEGGMIAATANSLRRWNTGAISDAAFRKECWADPPEALGETAQREGEDKPRNQ